MIWISGMIWVSSNQDSFQGSFFQIIKQENFCMVVDGKKQCSQFWRNLEMKNVILKMTIAGKNIGQRSSKSTVLVNIQRQIQAKINNFKGI